MLTNLGVRATFKIVGEKARVLESRGRSDVIAALKRHDIGYHTDTHSQQPTVAVYLQNAGWDDGRAEFYRREIQGVRDIQRIFGVTPEFIKAFGDLGYKNLSGDDLVKMRIHGVTPEFVKELNGLGYKNLDIADLVKMRIHGVTPDFIRQMKEVGYTVRVEKLVQFRIHGVDADLVRDLKARGFKDLSADDLVDFSIHGRRWLRKAE